MSLELIPRLQDLGQHVRVARRRGRLRQPGQGTNYMLEEMREEVRRTVSRLHPRRMRLRLTKILRETPSTKTFRFKRIDESLPPFRAGQYVNLFLNVGGVRTSRPFSIASPPGVAYLDLTVRNNPAGFVAPYMLKELNVGDELESTGPVGTFYYEPLIDGTDLVFLAGGSGITPFMSMLRDFVSRRREVSVRLLYGSRAPDDVIYAEELGQLAATHTWFHYAPVISEPPAGYDGLTGFLTPGLIRQQVGDVAGKTFYVCGPNVMYDFCLAGMKELGVPEHRIRRELYGPPSDVTREPGWPENLSAKTVFNVEVENRKTIPARAGEPLLVSLERHGLIVPTVCRAGECSACRVRLLAGQVFMPARTHLRESDRRNGYIHACVSYPVEDLRVRI